MVDLREAAPADRHAIRNAHVASIRGLAAAAYDDAVVEAWADAENRDPDGYDVESAENVFLVAVADGEVVGFGELADGPDAAAAYEFAADAEIRAVYVSPGHAGEGVGTALLGELERRGRDRGVSTVALTASVNAAGFYEANGYERVAEAEHAFGDGDATGPVVVMRKRR
ncbi:GNAT family N-acetyltransferase [Halolamina sp. C58]|uniref:GNAT family N-acetyltransferase n=1 Tax=Halolamina sp. C58 TaxID=3421640 RepID=UPI003EB8740A